MQKGKQLRHRLPYEKAVDFRLQQCPSCPRTTGRGL